MDFHANQKFFMHIAKNILQTHQSRLEKIGALCNFVIIDEGLTPDDEAVAARILRQLIWLSEQCIKEFKLTCKEIEPNREIIFGICECSLEDAINGVIAIYAYDSEEQLLSIPNMSTLPRFVNSHERMILVLDIYNRIEYIPWKI